MRLAASLAAEQSARDLRRAPTPAERALWYRLRRRQIGSAKFRRQVPIGAYVADFACLELRLIIELDGGQHADAIAHDRERTEYLARCGFRVVRFWNSEVFSNIEGVVETIFTAVAESRQDK